MLKNHLTIAFRAMRRSASYTVINIAGLALGITCALVIFLLVSHHRSFDNFHKHSERVYRFVTEQHRDEVSYVSSVPPVFGKRFREDFTYGEMVARVCSENAVVSFEHNGTVSRFDEDFSFAEETFLEIFNFPVIEGSNQLHEPGTALVTERIARKFFGNVSPVGKSIRIDNRMDFLITGLLKDLPDNTDFRNEILLSYLNIGQWSTWYASDDSWGGITSSIQTFVRLQPGVNPVEVEQAIAEYPKKYRPRSKNVHVYRLQPLNDMHFSSTYGGPISQTFLVVLSVIGFFLVFTACLNFINLATAQAAARAREVGVRKALGSLRTQLFWQFAVETFVIVVIAFGISFCVCYAIVPWMNELLNMRMTMELDNSMLWTFSALLVVALTFLAGGYPGIVLSGFKPVQALKGKMMGARTEGLNLRRILITTQFVISQILLIGLIVVVSQMHYFRHADMGFEKDAVVMLPLGSHSEKAKTLKQQLLQLPNVENVSMCFSAPASRSNWGTSVRFDNRDENEDFSSLFKGGDENFLATFGIDLVAGRNLQASDTVREILVNETMVAKLGETNESILGKTLTFNGDFKGPIVGVVNDFNDQSLHNAINPVFITTDLNTFNELAVKIRMTDVNNTIAELEKVWVAMYPEQIFRFTFVDDQTREFYQTEEMIMRVVEIFAAIALFIGCLGLYGLVSYMAVQKTKEIGIRKVLGGSIQHILWIFGKEFTRLILVAFAVAAPVGWVLMSDWLSNYAYRIDLTVWIFAANLGVIAIIVLLTVGFRSARAAMMNPVGALRAE